MLLYLVPACPMRDPPAAGLLNHPFPKKQPLSSPYTPAVVFFFFFFFPALQEKAVSVSDANSPQEVGHQHPPLQGSKDGANGCGLGGSSIAEVSLGAIPTHSSAIYLDA